MINLRQIADKAGCSTSTVSRALSNNGAVNPQVKQRVRKIANSLGYRVAANTAGKESNRHFIGVLVPTIANPVISISLESIQARMRQANVGVLIAQSNYDPVDEQAAIASLLSARPSGLILTLCSTGSIIEFENQLPPTVLLNGNHEDCSLSSATVDNKAASFALTEHLLNIGHRNVLYVSLPFWSSDRAKARFEGYKKAMLERGITPLDPMLVPFTDDHAMLELRDTIEGAHITAIIGSNDLLALKVISVLRKEGLRVPCDVSVAGFDGIDIGRFSTPSLTTIDMPDADMGTVAASMLLELIQKKQPPKRLQLDFRLRLGGTTMPIVA